MTGRKGKRGQAAIFLVLILAGLALLFALNVDVFTSSRSKIRLQNAADASALALARWQGVTLNLIGDLNLAHLAAVSQSQTNAIAGIVELQQRLAFIGPTIGFKAANDVAKENGVPVSQGMTRAVRMLADFTGGGYRQMLNVVLHDGIRAGVDNVKVVQNGPLANQRFYDAVRANDFRALCLWFNGGAHSLPNVGTAAPALEELLDGSEALFGNVGVGWDSGQFYASHIPNFIALARDCGLDDQITAAGLTTNASLFVKRGWCIYSESDWRDPPDEFSISRFPWLAPLRPVHSLMGGSCTIRVEGSVGLASLTAQTNYISAQAAAKTFGGVNGQRVIDIAPRIVLPSFAFARLVPFGFGANGRYGWANARNVNGFPRSNTGGTAEYQRLLDYYNSDEFRNAAEKWYSNHGHSDADGCRPPGHGTERGGGAPYGI